MIEGRSSTLAIRLAIMVIAVLGILGLCSVWAFFAFSNGTSSQNSLDPAITSGALNGLTVYSARCLTFLSVSLVLLIVQVVVVFRDTTWPRWWMPLLFEAAVGIAFAIASPQASGEFSSSCGETVSSCVIAWPSLIPVDWILVCGSIGVILGGTWSLRLWKRSGVRSQSDKVSAKSTR